MIDRVRRRRVVSINLFESLGDLDGLNVLVEEVTPERRAIIHQQMAEVGEAINNLPDRCREVLWLRRIENLSQKEIAAKLGMSEGTVEKHMARAAGLLAACLNAPNPSSAVGATRELVRDVSHGK
jgi:RNA polymerase sigma-70 factor (ECF subfamily)